MKKFSILILIGFLLFNCSKKDITDKDISKVINGTLVSSTDINISTDSTPHKCVIYKDNDGWYQLEIYKNENSSLNKFWQAPEILSRPVLEIVDIDNDNINELYYMFQSGIEDQKQFSLYLYIPLSERLLQANVTPVNSGNIVEILVEPNAEDYMIYNNFLKEKGLQLDKNLNLIE